MCQNKYNYKKIGETIKEIRKNAKLSQDDFISAANLPGTQRKRLGKIERGDADAVGKLDLDFFARIADFAGVSIGYILGEYDCPTRQIQDINEVTGLSEEAISSLIEMREDEKFVDEFLKGDALKPEDFWDLANKYGRPTGQTNIDYLDFITQITAGTYDYTSMLEVFFDDPASYFFPCYNPIKVRFNTINYLLSSKDTLSILTQYYLLDIIGEIIFKIRENNGAEHLLKALTICTNDRENRKIFALQMFRLQEELSKAIEDNKDVKIEMETFNAE